MIAAVTSSTEPRVDRGRVMVDGSRFGRRGRTGLPRAILLDATDNALGMCRPLVRRGVEVHLITGDGWTRCFTRSRGVHGHTLPELSEGQDVWVEKLRELAREGEAVLIPLTDRAVELLITRRRDIPARLRSFEQPDGCHLALMDKERMSRIAEDAGAAVPWWIAITALDELEPAIARATYPCVLKPALSHEWRARFGDDRVLPVEGPDELRELARVPLAAGLRVMVTDYVPGPEANVEEVVVVRLEDGSHPLVLTARKLRQYPVGFGSGALVTAAPADEARDLTLRVLEEADFVGVAGVETKRHAETGEVMLLDVNVRTTQFIALGTACGTEAAWRIYASLAGRPLGPQPPQRDGVKVVLPLNEARAVRGGKVRLRQVLSSYAGVRDIGLADPRDPGPLLGYLGMVLQSRLGARRAGRPG